ncbi:MAG: hypothetical protein V4813_07290 [Gemmatimonadota bacterium]
MLNSTRVSDASAAFLAITGLLLLFASEEMLPMVVPGFPPAVAWLGELVASGWLAMAILNWANRKALLGGVYGRPVVLTNLLFYFSTLMTLLRLASARAVPVGAFYLLVPIAIFTLFYARLLYRGPLGNDLERFKTAS